MVAVVVFDSAVIGFSDYKTCSLALKVDTDPANVFFNGFNRYGYGVLIALHINRVSVNILITL